jgi:hypothetical protein
VRHHRGCDTTEAGHFHATCALGTRCPLVDAQPGSAMPALSRTLKAADLASLSNEHAPPATEAPGERHHKRLAESIKVRRDGKGSRVKG